MNNINSESQAQMAKRKNVEPKPVAQPAGPSDVIEHIETGKLIPYARNSNTHSERQIAQIAGSIKEFGFCNPVLIDESGTIIAGHGRVMAAQLLSLPTCPCRRLGHLSDKQRRAYVIADNRLAKDSTFDNEMLNLELIDLKDMEFNLDVLGFGDEELQSLLEITIDEKPGGLGEPVDEDEIPEPPVDPITKPGDLWILGTHRLLCGDSTKAADVARLMVGNAINIAFTSPPYASQRKYDESSGFKPIPPDEYVAWWEPIQASVATHLAADGSFFVNIKPNADGMNRELYVFDLVLAHARRWGWNFAEEFCWERNGIPQKVTRRFKNNFEPVYQFTKSEWKIRPDAVRHPSKNVPVAKGPGAGDTNAARRQGTGVCAVGDNDEKEGLAYPSNRLPPFASQALGHSAAFPVGLPSFFIKAFTDEADNVYEPFCGSGSTLIAAEQLSRRCFGMEISPAYCDIIVKRWENLTGKTATLETDRPES